MSKDTALRYLTMISLIPTGTGSKISPKKLSKKLEKNGLKIGVRSIERDLRKLKLLFDLECVTGDNGKYYWRYHKQKTNITSELQPSEALALLICQPQIEQLMPDNLAWLNKRFEKAETLLSKQNQYSNWRNKVSMVSDSLLMDFTLQSPDIRKTIYDCVLREQQVIIDYQSEKSDQIKKYELNALGLIIRDQSHYLVATKVEKPEEPRLFLLHRISHAISDHLPISKPKTFTIEDYLQKNPSGFLLSDEKHSVQLKVKGYPLDIINRNKLGDSQRLQQIDETWQQVSFDSYIIYDLANWIIRYGGDVICQSPPILLDYVKKKILKAHQAYF